MMRSAAQLVCLMVALTLSVNCLPAAGSRDPSKMQWWDVCIEHGRNLRAKVPMKEGARAAQIQAFAHTNGFLRSDEDAVIRREPRLGMDVCTAMAMFGQPNANNRSVGSWGTDEQWVYRSRRLYLYFRNEKLTSFQQG